jgi:hypothetical protein
MSSNLVDWLTLIFSAFAGGGSLVRIFQNERLYRWHKKMHKKRKKK